MLLYSVEMNEICLTTNFSEPISGRVSAREAVDPGSIPGWVKPKDY